MKTRRSDEETFGNGGTRDAYREVPIKSLGPTWRERWYRGALTLPIAILAAVAGYMIGAGHVRAIDIARIELAEANAEHWRSQADAEARACHDTHPSHQACFPSPLRVTGGASITTPNGGVGTTISCAGGPP